ncbi:hypothetical protein LUZ60_016975 [Juncus effusus]|nr:hypothetical protein LUZ60_016975 [Juncus effusus]
MQSKNQARSNNFSQLSTVFSELCLIIFLFFNSTLSNLASKFAKCCRLEIPCFICSKLCRIPWFSGDGICEAHKLEISSLSYCGRHSKLCFAQDLCQICDLSCSNLIKANSKSEKGDCSCCFRKRSNAQNAPKDEDNVTERKEKPFHDMKSLIDLESESKPKFKNPVTNAANLSLCTNISDSRKTSCSNGLEEINWNQTRTSGTGTNKQIISDPSPSKRSPCHISIKRVLSNRAPFQSPRPSEIISSKENLTTHDDIQNLISQIAFTPRVGLKSPPSVLFDESVERNSSSLDSFVAKMVSDVEGESDVAKLRRQVEMDKKNMRILYKELEEERNASDIAASEAMAMINRLQKEKAEIKMESLHYLRMMEEEAEHDKEAIEKLNELLTEREKELLDLEAEVEEFKRDFLKFENGLVLGFEEKGFVKERLKWLEEKLEMENGENFGVEMENGELKRELIRLNEKFGRIEMDERFISHVLGGVIVEDNEGIKYVEEIAGHLRELRKINIHAMNQ